MITFTCSPDVDEGLGASGKGIMYWLGTNKGTSDYFNPYTSGAVAISGWFEDDECSFIGEDDKVVMVQYKPNPEGEKSVGCDDYSDFECIFNYGKGAMMGCGSLRCGREGPLDFHLLNGVAVSPTHYSIRNGSCYGMSGDWNLEASIDGKNWDVIHESRGRSPLFRGIREPECVKIWDKVEKYKGAERKDAVCNHLEQNHRHTWKVVNTSGNFYTHFRIKSIHIEEVGVWGTEEYRETCLHGIGFELYGDVYEEWK